VLTARTLCTKDTAQVVDVNLHDTHRRDNKHRLQKESRRKEPDSGKSTKRLQIKRRYIIVCKKNEANFWKHAEHLGL